MLLRGDDVEREHRQHGAVHRHRHRHLIERYAGEQRAHVIDGIDRDAGHADIAGDARVVAVVTAMGSEVEGDRQALLTGGEVAPIERIGIFGGGEAGILPDRPWLGHVHGRVGPAQIRRDAGIAVETIETLEVIGAVGALDRQSLRRKPRRGRCRRRGGRIGKIDLREVRDTAHPIIRSRHQAYRKRS